MVVKIYEGTNRKPDGREYPVFTVVYSEHDKRQRKCLALREIEWEKERFCEKWRMNEREFYRVILGAATLKKHLLGLLEYFHHQITNAVTEAFNATIQSLKATARGFRNFDHYKIRIHFFLGRLNLHPL